MLIVNAFDFTDSKKLPFAGEVPKVSSDPVAEDYPFAMKIMFNYYIESNALSILRAMYREGVPALWDDASKDMLSCWQAE